MTDIYIKPDENAVESVKELLATIIPPVGMFLSLVNLQEINDENEAYYDARTGINNNLDKLKPNVINLASSAGTYLYVVVKAFEPPPVIGEPPVGRDKMQFTVDIVGQGFSLEGALINNITMNDFNSKFITLESNARAKTFFEKISPVSPDNIEVSDVNYTLRSGTYVSIDLISYENGIPQVDLKPIKKSKDAYFNAIKKSSHRPNLKVQVSPDTDLMKNLELIRNEYLNVRRIVRGIVNYEVATIINRQYATQAAMLNEIEGLVEAYNTAAEISHRNENLTKFTGLVRLGLMAGEYVYNVSEKQLVDDRRQVESNTLNKMASSLDKGISALLAQVNYASGEFQSHKAEISSLRGDIQVATEFLSDLTPVLNLLNNFKNKELHINRNFDENRNLVDGSVLFNFGNPK